MSLILMVYQDKGNKFKISTKIKTDKNNWTGSRIKGKSLEVTNFCDSLFKRFIYRKLFSTFRCINENSL
jgi:hypothetical protein